MSILETKFQKPLLEEGWKWFTEPKKYKVAAKENNEGLHITLDKGDFWKRTFYDPPLIVDNGHFLHIPVKEERVVMETSFSLQNPGQFDQGGLMVRIDGDHWIKTGLEFVDGAAKLSCVVTNVNSDWSTQTWPSTSLSIRVYKFKDDFVIEAKFPEKNEWDFFRICHLNISENQEVFMGPFACAPKTDGGTITFDYLTYKKTGKYHHTA